MNPLHPRDDLVIKPLPGGGIHIISAYSDSLALTNSERKALQAWLNQTFPKTYTPVKPTAAEIRGY
jgi:hypothetical protein